MMQQCGLKKEVSHEFYLLNWGLVNDDAVESSPNDVMYEDSLCSYDLYEDFHMHL